MTTVFEVKPVEHLIFSECVDSTYAVCYRLENSILFGIIDFTAIVDTQIFNHNTASIASVFVEEDIGWCF